jgi:hypothetical protein
MTTLREAAQQALEALEWNLAPIEDFGDKEQLHRQHKAITALRAALAEPVQEPVAWMVYTLDGKSVCVTDNPADFTDEHRVLPLYTTPPPMKPLTEKEILRVLRLAPPEPSLWPHLKEEAVVGDVQRAVLAITRAVERAHGIKEGT